LCPLLKPFSTVCRSNQSRNGLSRKILIEILFVDSIFLCCYEVAVFEKDTVMKRGFFLMNNWWWQTKTQEGFVRR
jgi:hypothetical protein